MPTLTTAKATCRTLASLLAAHGVTDAVVSPGSRNTPLLIALSRQEGMRLYPVIDERSAAFVALGLSTVSSRPTAIVCTSGTALLNYAPAVAEAYYRKVPLIVISADRPAEWIGQDDSQTIRQPGALAPWVKNSYDIPATDQLDSTRWLATRLINDAMLTAMNGRRGPVHINVQLDTPLGELTDKAETPRVIDMLMPRTDLTVAESRRLGSLVASPRKVLIVAGFNAPDQKLNKAMLKLAALPNVAILAESLANLHGPDIIHRVDTTLTTISPEEEETYRPDVIISLGGALVSRHLKEFLRRCDNAEHWHVSLSDTTIDCFRHLTLRIEMKAGVFFNQLASAMQPHRAECDYNRAWHALSERAAAEHDRYVSTVPWSDMRAFAYMIPRIPTRWNIQLSNGTSVRYFQLFNDGTAHRCDCNRGVSGIDGCTSTAIGASLAYRSDVTLLITGDTCATYDIGALGSQLVTPRLKIIVICNGGGGIFRTLGSIARLEECDELFCMPRNLPFAQLARAYGYTYFEASSEDELANIWNGFISETERPALFAINTPPRESADIYRHYFKRHITAK